MVQYLSLGFPLFILAALWPPYNVLIAEALINRKYWMVSAILISSLLGLSLCVYLLVQGAKLTNINFELIGGFFVLVLSLKMFFSKKPESRKKTIIEHAQSLWTIFFISFMPGVYSVTAAAGFIKKDLGQVITVYLAGPLFGILLGGVLMAYGVKYASLPLNKIGGILLFIIAIKMII